MGRGQMAMEYLLVAGFAFLLLVPIILIAYTQSARFQNDVTAAQIEKVGNQIIDATNAVYYAGPPTKKTIKLYFPEGIQGIQVQDNTIKFTVQGSSGSYDYVAFAQSNLSGALRHFKGVHTLTVTADVTQVNISDT